MAVISLIVLAVVVAIGFIKKVNLGFLSLGVAYIPGMAGGMTAKQITAGFDSSMFVTLVGVTFLFGMASNNGTLDLFSKKVVALVGKHTVLIPILMFALSAFISAIGPGHIAAGILMTTFAMYLAFEMDINSISTALYAKLGANAGCASVLSLTGILARRLAGTAAPILAASSGILSWVSSTTGVVMPALFPIAAEVCERFQGVSYVELISAITATSFAAAISPLSTGGAIISLPRQHSGIAVEPGAIHLCPVGCHVLRLRGNERIYRPGRKLLRRLRHVHGTGADCNAES